MTTEDEADLMPQIVVRKSKLNGDWQTETQEIAVKGKTLEEAYYCMKRTKKLFRI